MRCLEKERSSRFASARALAEALEGARSQADASIAPVVPPLTPNPQEIELGETDLAIRVSQVVPERRADADSRAPRSFPAPAQSEEPGQRGLVIVAILVALAAIVAGVLLALR